MPVLVLFGIVLMVPVQAVVGLGFALDELVVHGVQLLLYFGVVDEAILVVVQVVEEAVYLRFGERSDVALSHGGVDRVLLACS